jgi:hypothetical protein
MSKYLLLTLSATLLAINGCAVFKNPIIGKWMCNKVSVDYVDYIEFLPNGRMISTTESLKDKLPKGDAKGRFYAWKTNGDSLSFDSILGVIDTRYQVSGNQLQFDPPNGRTCNRVID